MRIRTIKPEFWTHPEILRLSIPARLLHAALFNQADDKGRLYDQPMKIQAEAFGEHDRVNIARLLEELSTEGRILRYESRGRRCIQIVNFNKHQSISHPRDSSIPPPDSIPEPSGTVPVTTPEDSLNDAASVPAASGGERNGMEQGTGKGTGNSAPALAGGVPFAEFWKVYPIHRDRKQAETAWKKAVKRADPALIIAGAVRYRDDPNRDPAKTKYAQGWLNGDRWEDDPLPAGNDKPADRAAALMRRALEDGP